MKCSILTVSFASLLNVVFLSAGVRADSVYTWGNNGYGQLGDGTTTTRTSPIPVPGLGNGVTVAAMGAFDSLAVQRTREQSSTTLKHGQQKTFFTQERTKMNSRGLWIIVIAALLLVLANGQRPVSESQAGDVGRYQLYAGPYASHAAESLLYRIDTRTGKTWEYMAQRGDVGPPFWHEVSEHPGPLKKP